MARAVVQLVGVSQDVSTPGAFLLFLYIFFSGADMKTGAEYQLASISIDQSKDFVTDIETKVVDAAVQKAISLQFTVARTDVLFQGWKAGA